MVQQQPIKKISVVISKLSWIASELLRLKAQQTARLCSVNSCNGGRSQVGGDGDAAMPHERRSPRELVPLRKEE
jgi:hypothetical protein